MNEFKGTRGWRLQEDGVIIDDNYNTVADFMVSDLYDLANAKLAEKAPEMLEMIEELIHCFEYENNSSDECDILNKARQLLKQATEL